MKNLPKKDMQKGRVQINVDSPGVRDLCDNQYPHFFDYPNFRGRIYLLFLLQDFTSILSCTPENLIKEKFDSKIFDVGIKQAATNKDKKHKTFFLYAASYYRWRHRRPMITKLFMAKMQVHKIHRAVLTLGQVSNLSSNLIH